MIRYMGLSDKFAETEAASDNYFSGSVDFEVAVIKNYHDEKEIVVTKGHSSMVFNKEEWEMIKAAILRAERKERPRNDFYF